MPVSKLELFATHVIANECIFSRRQDQELSKSAVLVHIDRAGKHYVERCSSLPLRDDLLT